jgi:hypothetical protein
MSSASEAKYATCWCAGQTRTAEGINRQVIFRCENKTIPILAFAKNPDPLAASALTLNNRVSLLGSCPEFIWTPLLSPAFPILTRQRLDFHQLAEPCKSHHLNAPNSHENQSGFTTLNQLLLVL